MVNTGWGENLFLKDIWPKARHVAYFEYYYAAKGQDMGFDPEFPVRNEEVIWRLRVKNAHAAAAPSTWPTPPWRRPATSATPSRLGCGTGSTVIHDGIEAQDLRPDPAATIQVGSRRARALDRERFRSSPT